MGRETSGIGEYRIARPTISPAVCAGSLSFASWKKPAPGTEPDAGFLDTTSAAAFKAAKRRLA
ncbi:hypothetical protein [Burkholderia sp. MSMB1078WGS]|uniref:hypothetical protein n=1 Tax=Burkholderia sp. MSMB1078WGS TaxID=1637900 RepID=UPI000AB2AF8E|nr:hypothetical protein [Burkholderia sp. MSMB1078WGS]